MNPPPPPNNSGHAIIMAGGAASLIFSCLRGPGSKLFGGRGSPSLKSGWLAISLLCVSSILPVSVSPLPGRHFVVGVLIHLNLKNFKPGRVLGLLRGGLLLRAGRV